MPALASRPEGHLSSPLRWTRGALLEATGGSLVESKVCINYRHPSLPPRFLGKTTRCGPERIQVITKTRPVLRSVCATAGWPGSVGSGGWGGRLRGPRAQPGSLSLGGWHPAASLAMGESLASGPPGGLPTLQRLRHGSEIIGSLAPWSPWAPLPTGGANQAEGGPPTPGEAQALRKVATGHGV